MIESPNNNPIVYHKIKSRLKIRYIIDRMTITDNSILGSGWLSHDKALSLSKIYLIINFQNDTKKFPCKTMHRPDLVKLNSPQHIVNSSFTVSATFSKDKIKKLSLELTFIDHQKNETCVILPMSSEIVRIMKHKIKKALSHARKGEVKTLFNKTYRLVFSKKSKQFKVDKKALKRFQRFCMAENKSLVLIIDHNLGGGANLYREQLISKLLKNGKAIFLLYNNIVNSNYLLHYLSPLYETAFAANTLKTVFSVISSLPLKEIYFNNCFSYTQPSSVPSFLVKLKEKTKAQIFVAVNDYFMICPSFNLLNSSGKFCGIPSLDQCQKCLNAHTGEIVKFSNCKDILKWRRRWGNCLQAATQIICFSNSSKQLLNKAYPKLDSNKVVCIPHQVDYLPNRKPQISFKPSLNIGIVGSIQYHKGAKIIGEMAKLIIKWQLPIKISVIGSLSGDSDSSVLTVYGSYKQEQLTDIIENIGANIFFLPSICPETFSFTTSELMQLEVPLAVFDIGAPAERVRDYKKGLIIKEINAEFALTKLIEFYNSLCLEQQPLIVN